MSRRSLRTTLGAWKELIRLRSGGVPFPPVAPLLGRDGVFIGCSNSAGQGWAWARALERVRPDLQVVSARFNTGQETSSFRFPVDQPILSRYAAHSDTWQRRQLAALREYRAIVIESGDPILARAFGGDTAAQAAALAHNGVRIALLFHGSDIRDPDAHLIREPHSHFAADPALADELRVVTARNRALADELATPVFVSTPDLLSEREDAIWLPVVVEPGRWQTVETPVVAGRPIRVAHVPSNSVVKGTDLILATLRELSAEGVIEYLPIEGRPHAEMPDAYRSVDIVLDQFRAGIYGVATCEALAAGRIVVSHVSDDVRARTRSLTGEDLPVVEASADTLSSVLRDIALNPDGYREVAGRGPGFVRRHHDGARSGEVLARWLAD